MENRRIQCTNNRCNWIGAVGDLITSVEDQEMKGGCPDCGNTLFNILGDVS